MKRNVYKYLLIALAVAITGCEDPVLSAPVGEVLENAQAGVVVSQVTVTNAGSSTLKSIVIDGSGSENFAVSSAGLITVAQGANLDFETAQAYTLSVTATNTRGQSVSGDIRINILDVADVVASISGFSTFVAEGIAVGTLVGTIGVTDSGDSAITSFTLSDQTTFSINEKGEIRTNTILDYELQTNYDLSVSAINSAGESQSVNVNITVSNVADVIPLIMGFQTSVKKDIAVGTVVGQVTIHKIGDTPITSFTISEPEIFDISLEGVVTTKVLFHYDDRKLYEMEVVATNDAGTDTGFVEVTLLESYTVKPFTANYYEEADGTQAGQGTDGSDVTIVPVLKHTETVARPSINYSYSYKFDTSSYNFYAEYEGEIEAHEDVNISVNFALSWSDVSFYLDNVLVSKWANSNKVIPLNLKTGTHSVRIEYHNHWHTTNFNVSFTDYERTSVTQDLFARVSDTAQINYISAYSIAPSANRALYNEVEVTIPKSYRGHVLFLTSYVAVNWVIKNPFNTKLEGIVFNSYQPGSTVSNTGKAFVLHAPDFAYYSNIAQGTENITSMLGRGQDYLHDENYFYDIEIPTLF